MKPWRIPEESEWPEFVQKRDVRGFAGSHADLRR